MLRPENPLEPPGAVFDEAWQAQSLALADSLVRAGIVTPGQWADALGAALRAAAAAGADDTAESYYRAVVSALEVVISACAGVSPASIAERRLAWEAAYARTPHGQPVTL